MTTPVTTPVPPNRAPLLRLGPRTLLALSGVVQQVVVQNEAVAALVDAYLEGAGADTRRSWRLVLTGAEIVPDDPPEQAAAAEKG